MVGKYIDQVNSVDVYFSFSDMPEGSSRFNNLPTSSSSSNGGVGQQLSGGNSHNMLNEVLGVIPGGGSTALNGHLDRALHHQHHHQQQNIRQNSGIVSLTKQRWLHYYTSFEE